MVYDIIKHDKLIGKSKNEVYKLLGTQMCWEEENTINYIFGTGFTTGNLIIKLDENDMVYKCSKYIE
jgi:hypothetical protein